MDLSIKRLYLRVLTDSGDDDTLRWRGPTVIACVTVIPHRLKRWALGALRSGDSDTGQSQVTPVPVSQRVYMEARPNISS